MTLKIVLYLMVAWSGILKYNKFIILVIMLCDDDTHLNVNTITGHLRNVDGFSKSVKQSYLYSNMDADW